MRAVGQDLSLRAARNVLWLLSCGEAGGREAREERAGARGSGAQEA